MMSEEVLDKIEKKLADTNCLDDAAREELQGLVRRLREEVGALSDDKAEHAESIAGFAGAATHEATRSDANPELLDISVRGLKESVKDLEVEHPRLVEVTNSICTMLSNLGI